MNIFKSRKQLRNQLNALQEVNDKLVNDCERQLELIDQWQERYERLEKDRDQWAENWKQNDKNFTKLQEAYDKIAKLVREQAEADETYAAMKIITNRLSNKPKAEDKPFRELQANAQARLQELALVGQQQVTMRGLVGLGGAFGGVLGPSTLGPSCSWPYGGLG